ncbi:PEBP family protein [Celeribacter sp. ULVN23_4]
MLSDPPSTPNHQHRVDGAILRFATLPFPQPLSAETFSADVWADNWFEMRIDGVQVAEDSVPITTERSFNAESFTFEAERPFTIGLVAMDFRENDTGLEYIGTDRQQMGDGGVIVQIMDAMGMPVAVSDASWQCFLTHTAPLDKSCESVADPVAGEGACGFEMTEEPEGWDTAAFNASDWPQADVYSVAEVDPKLGYDEIDWADSAELIWGPDLEQSNTLLCRVTVE